MTRACQVSMHMQNCFCCSTDQPFSVYTPGKLPDELEKLTMLERFWVWNNQLTGMMSALLLAAALTSLHCVSSPPGSLPAELGKLTKLKGFNVRNNQLTGMMSVMSAV
jgi:hypothetical protein